MAGYDNAKRHHGRRLSRRRLGSFAACSLLVLLLATCARAPQAPVPTAPPQPPGVASPESRSFVLDPAASEVLVLVYRGGRLARFGHNHVVRIRKLEGRLDLAEPLSASLFTLGFPVAAMEFDDPQLRARQGAGFETPLRPADIAATRRNLLGPALLDEQAHPGIEVRGRVLGGTLPHLLAELEFQVRGWTSYRELPLEVRFDGRTFQTSGELELFQTELGLTPFSLMLGALRVEDRMSVKYRLVLRDES